MAGHLISLYLNEQGYQVVGFAREKSKLVESVIGDAAHPACVQEVIENGKFDTVINCIGLLNQFAEDDKASAVYLNSYFPHYIAQLTEGTKTQIIHISTDCVFCGDRGQYTEDDLQDGTSFYSRTKALGELNDNKNLTFRQSIVGPDIKSSGIGLMNWFMQQKGEIQGYSKAIWTGMTSLQLAKAIEAAAHERAHGLYHMVPDMSISKCDLLRLFNQYLRGGNVQIVPVDKMASDKSLKRTKWDFDYRVPDYERMVAELAEWMKVHKELYPHFTFV